MKRIAGVVLGVLALGGTAHASTLPIPEPQTGLAGAFEVCNDFADSVTEDAAALGLTDFMGMESTAEDTIESARRFITFDGDAIVIDGAYDTVDLGPEYADVWWDSNHVDLVYDCVNAVLGMPTRVAQHIGQTRALDGMQEDTWDGVTARWTYHPDDGVIITYWVSDPDALQPLAEIPDELAPDLSLMAPAPSAAPSDLDQAVAAVLAAAASVPPTSTP